MPSSCWMSYANSPIPPADRSAVRRLKLDGAVKTALWGSERWEVSARPEAPSRISDGPLAGRGLDEVHPRFPLLFKTIDAKARLSVQVHPNEVTCRVTGGEPKTEMWCALADSTVFAGLRPGTGAAELEAAVRANALEELLVRHELKAGDAVFIPGGLVHAIGDGALLYEVQQSSDTTFRLYDWGRVGADGRPRELHVASALAAADCSLPPPVPVKYVESPFFSFSQVRLSGEKAVGGDGGFVVVRSARGAFRLDGEEFPEGASVLLPPGAGGTLCADGAWLLLTRF